MPNLIAPIIVYVVYAGLALFITVFGFSPLGVTDFVTRAPIPGVEDGRN